MNTIIIVGKLSLHKLIQTQLKAFITLFLFIFLIPFTAIAYPCDECVYQEALYSGVFPPAKIYYTGISYQGVWIPVKGDWKRFLDKPHGGAGFYFGRRFHDRIGLEVGYEWNINRPKSTLVLPGQSILGEVNNTGQKVIITGRCRFKTGYVDLHLFFPLFVGEYFECFRKTFRPEFIFLAGLENSLPKFRLIAEPNGSIFTNNILCISGKTRPIFRIGAGFQTFIWNDFIFRAMYRYHNTNRLRGRNGIAVFPQNQRVFGNMSTISLGLYMVFRPF